MHKLFFSTLFLIFTTGVFAQISVQTVAYWDKNEKYSFNGNYEYLKIVDKDTTVTMRSTYEVDVTVLDSTANSYTVEWQYKNHKHLSENEIMQNIMNSMDDNARVLIQTDEYGSFQKVLNMDEIMNFYKEQIKMLKRKFKKESSDYSSIINDLETKFNSETYILNNSINDIKNYYAFHGAKYELLENYEAQLKTPNNYGGEAFDTDVKAYLAEIDSENNTYIMRTHQVINQKQLKLATLDYLNKKNKENNLKPLSIESIPDISNNLWIANRIHGSGWTTFSLTTREVVSEGIKNVIEFSLQMQ